MKKPTPPIKHTKRPPIVHMSTVPAIDPAAIGRALAEVHRQMEDRPSRRMLSVSQAGERASFSKATTYRLIAAGLFPKPRPLLVSATGQIKRSGIPEEEVVAWLAVVMQGGPVEMPKDVEGPDAA